MSPGAAHLGSLQTSRQGWLLAVDLDQGGEWVQAAWHLRSDIRGVPKIFWSKLRWYFTALGDSTKDRHKYILKGTMMNTPFWVSPCKKEIMYSTHLLDSLVTNRWQIGLQTSYVSGFGTSHKKGTTLKCCHCSYSEASTLILNPFLVQSILLISTASATTKNIPDDNIYDKMQLWSTVCTFDWIHALRPKTLCALL